MDSIRVWDGFLPDLTHHFHTAATRTYSVEEDSPVLQTPVEGALALQKLLEARLERPVKNLTARYQWYPARETERLTVVHPDRRGFSGVCYLSPAPAPETLGTRFCRHRLSGLEHLPPPVELSFVALEQRLNPTDLARLLVQDQTRGEAWETVHQVAYLPNRLVVFPGPTFHAPGPFWGTEPADSRLTLNFFFE